MRHRKMNNGRKEGTYFPFTVKLVNAELHAEKGNSEHFRSFTFVGNLFIISMNVS